MDDETGSRGGERSESSALIDLGADWEVPTPLLHELRDIAAKAGLVDRRGVDWAQLATRCGLSEKGLDAVRRGATPSVRTLRGIMQMVRRDAPRYDPLRLLLAVRLLEEQDIRPTRGRTPEQSQATAQRQGMEENDLNRAIAQFWVAYAAMEETARHMPPRDGSGTPEARARRA